MAILRVLTGASLFSTALAGGFFQKRSSVSDIVPQPTCNGVTFATLGTNYCCPGIFEGTDTSNGAYCCVGATNLPIPRFSDCHPTCGSSTTSAPATLTPASQSCLTTIMVTDSDYTNKVNSLGATQTSINSFGASGPISVHSTISSASEVSSSASSAASTTALSGTRTSSSGSSGQSSSAGSGSSSAGSSSTSASKALGARITSGPMAGAFMIAGGVVAIAAL